MSLENFKTFFLGRQEKVQLFVSRKAEVQSALTGISIMLNDWIKEMEDAREEGHTTYDLRAQYMMPELKELRRQNDFLNKEGERNPRQTWLKQEKLLEKIEELKEKIEFEKSIPYIDSIDGFACTILDYNLVPSEFATSWVDTEQLRIQVDAILPREFGEKAEKGEGGIMLYALTQEAASEVVAPYRERAAAKVSALSSKIESMFSGRAAGEAVTLEERNQLVDDMNDLNRELHRMAHEASDAALERITDFVNELKNKQPEARSNWIFRFVKKLILGIASLGVAIARLVVSCGTDAFAYIGGVKAIVAISSELYDAFKSAQLVHTQLKKNINTLKAQLIPDTAELKSQTVAGGKELAGRLLGILGITPSFISTFLTTCGGTADNITLFRSKLRALNVKCGDMLLKVKKALKGISELKNSGDATEEDLKKIPTMETVINNLLDKIHDLQKNVRGYTLEAIEAEVVLKNYSDAYNSIIPKSSEQENFGIGDLATILGLATGIDTCFGSPMTSIVVDPIKSAVQDAVKAA